MSDFEGAWHYGKAVQSLAEAEAEIERLTRDNERLRSRLTDMMRAASTATYQLWMEKWVKEEGKRDG